MSYEAYEFSRDQLPELLLRKFFPEKTDRESALILEYLQRHAGEFERYSLSVRIGEGAPQPPGLDAAVSRAMKRSTQKRIDLVVWFGSIATLVEAKQHVSHEVLGQLLTDRHLWQEEFPDAPEPKLVAIGRTANDDALRVLQAAGIDVFLYAEQPTV